MARKIRKIAHQIASLALALAIAAGIAPTLAARALDMGSGEFNFTTGKITVEFSLQYTQHVDIEAAVNGKLFGHLILDDIIEGYSGSHPTPRDPCTMEPYTPAPPADSTHSVGTASAAEVSLTDLDGGPPLGGRYRLTWNGSINGYPVISEFPESDSYEVTISIKPHGMPEMDAPCDLSDPEDPIHGADLSWPSQYEDSADITVDLASIADPAAGGITLALEDGISRTLMDGLEDSLGNWFAPEAIRGLQQDIDSEDPVNLIDGSYHFEHTDLRLEGAVPLAFTRAYNSRGWDGSLGRGFTHALDFRIADDDGVVSVRLPGGERLVFLRLRPHVLGDYYAMQGSGYELYSRSI